MLFGLLTLLASASFAGSPPSPLAWPVPVVAFEAAPPAAASDADPDEEKPESIDYWSMLFVFPLSTFIGMGVIGRVSRLLHTPLMSLTNAISAISVVAAIEIAGEGKTTLSTILGTLAVTAASANIIGGFMITDRMLKMFKKRNAGKRA